MKKKRLIFPDVLKGITILLVILGHSIQYGNGTVFLKNQDFFSNELFKFIYGFHMPLFMAISGYFVFYSLKKNSGLAVLRGRCISLGWIIFFWNSLSFVLQTIKNRSFDLNYTFFKKYIIFLISNLWFLWAVIFCTTIIVLVKYIWNDSLIVYFILWFSFFVIPDFVNSSLWKFVFPFFLMGYLFNKYNVLSIYKCISIRRRFCIMLFLMIIYFASLKLYSFNVYIYNSGYFVIKNGNFEFNKFLIDIFRMILGMIGTLMACLVTELTIFKSKVNFVSRDKVHIIV